MSDIEVRTQMMLDRARSTVITDQASYDCAVEIARAIKALRAEAEAHYRPVIDAALRTHRAALEAFRRIDDPLRQAEAEIKRRISEWIAEQERLRREAEQRARAETERLMDEALESKIERLEQAGASVEEIEALIRAAEAFPTVAPKIGPTYQRDSGVAKQTRYKAEVHDLSVLVAWIAANPSYLNLLQPNMSALNALARAHGQSLDIPGVRVVIAESIAIRR